MSDRLCDVHTRVSLERVATCRQKQRLQPGRRQTDRPTADDTELLAWLAMLGTADPVSTSASPVSTPGYASPYVEIRGNTARPIDRHENRNPLLLLTSYRNSTRVPELMRFVLRAKYHCPTSHWIRGGNLKKSKCSNDPHLQYHYGISLCASSFKSLAIANKANNNKSGGGGRGRRWVVL